MGQVCSTARWCGGGRGTRCGLGFDVEFLRCRYDGCLDLCEPRACEIASSEPRPGWIIGERDRGRALRMIWEQVSDQWVCARVCAGEITERGQRDYRCPARSALPAAIDRCDLLWSCRMDAVSFSVSLYGTSADPPDAVTRWREACIDAFSRAIVLALSVH